MPLTLQIPEAEYYDSTNNLFYQIKNQTLTIEHSLYSMSKWEMKWKVPYLTTDKNDEQIIDYLRCMTINKNVDPMLYYCLSRKHILEIKRYMEDPMTATTFNTDKPNQQNQQKKKAPQKILTTEEVYWQMSALNIPFECDKWHWNRLQVLIKIANIRNAPPKKMSKKESLRRNRELNEARKLAMHTKG